ncbi:MAG: hypothetical protein ABEJ89_01410 [Haloarculaceae archaeon]
MGEQPAHPDEEQPVRPDQRDELRTMAFRMREIQRLLSVRVEQENRRLEAEGIDRVSVSRFREESNE